jgi:RNA polymerase sigma factor, sigma-70 family
MKEIDFQNDLLPLKNKLYRLAQRITLDSLEAEDVVEDTLVRVWERRKSLTDVENLEVYCLTICRNLALDRAERKDAQHAALDANFEAPADTTTLPDAQLEADERLAWVRRSFEMLPEKQRTALQLRDIDGHSYQEVATAMDISESDVKVTLHRARQALKEKLSHLRFHL